MQLLETFLRKTELSVNDHDETKTRDYEISNDTDPQKTFPSGF